MMTGGSKPACAFYNHRSGNGRNLGLIGVGVAVFVERNQMIIASFWFRRFFRRHFALYHQHIGISNQEKTQIIEPDHGQTASN